MNSIFTSLKRTPYQTFGSLLILFFTLFLALFFFNTTSFFYGILGYVETRPQVIAYFDVRSKEGDIVKIKQAIEKTGKTTSVKYVSQNEALGIYKKLNKDNPILLEMVSANILPASLEIYATRPEYLSEIAQFLEGQKIVEEVNFQKIIVDRLVTLTQTLRYVSIGVFAFLILMTTTVLITTTAFKIAVKKDEIEVLQLIGASKGYIRKPFLAEGVLFGWLSATIAFVTHYLIFFLSLPTLKSYLTGLPPLSFFNLQSLGLFVFPPSFQYLLMTYAIMTLFGMLIGLFGNYIATSKYIK
jgi:cell division transport system permease protein